MRRAVLLSAILAIAGLVPPRGFIAAAPAPQQPVPRFRSGVDVVEVAVLAKDREGKPVTDLTRDEICASLSKCSAAPSGSTNKAAVSQNASSWR